MTISLARLSLIVLALWIFTTALVQDTVNPISQILHAIVVILIMFIISGLTINHLISPIRKHQDDFPLYLTLGILSSIFIAPLPLTAISALTILNATSIVYIYYGILLLIPLSFKAHAQLWVEYPPLSWRYIIHPVSIAVVVATVVHTISLRTYPFLPGLDSYSWVITYEKFLGTNLYDMSYGINRMLFSTLVASLGRLTSISTFNLFKYTLPYLSLLAIPSLWLLARHLNHRWAQILVLLSLFASPALILDAQTSRHQLVVTIFLFSASGLLLTAQRRTIPSLLSLTLLYSSLGALYHPIFLFFATVLALGSLYAYRHKLRQHWILSTIGIVAAIRLSDELRLDQLIRNAADRLHPAIPNFFTGNWNLTFPHQYISDNFVMSWPGLAGAARYYGNYAGPVTLLVIATTIILLAVSAPTRKLFRKHLTGYNIPILLLLLFFFTIAEVLTRFANIAYLPDRAWMLISILTAPLLLLTLMSTNKLSSQLGRLTQILISIALLVSIGGALYINNLLQYTMPPYEFRAASWIEKNLPHNRIFFTSSSKNILRYHAGGELLRLDPAQIESANLSDITDRITKHHSEISQKNTYIYYARTHPLNPFQDRPYASSFTGTRSASTFPAIQSHPEHFELVYQDDDLVFIWHVRQDNL